MSFKKIDLKSLQFNPFTKIGKEWFLITGGNEESFNTMTASWGEMGHLWNRNVVTAFIRPQRYTKEFIDAKDTFSISFVPDTHRKALNYLGSVSGHDEKDKITKTDLTPVAVGGEMSFQEAELVFICKKLYHDALKPEKFLEDTLADKFYPEKDFHEIYVAEILEVYVKD